MHGNLRRVSFAVICLAALALAVCAPQAERSSPDQIRASPGDVRPFDLRAPSPTITARPSAAPKSPCSTKKPKNPPDGSTDGTGQYHFENLLPGKYTVSFDASGFISKQHQVNLKPGTKKIEVNERLKPPPEPEPKP